MSRYKVVSPWSDHDQMGNFRTQTAEIEDTKNGHRYDEGAFRVIDVRTGKPAKVGKGGTVPFYGEMAWAAAQRLMYDLAFKDSRNNG